MPTCCAFGCSNNSVSGYKLYRLPVGKRNEERRKLWLLRIRRDKWTPNENTKLCEVHFAEDQFESHRVDNRRLLKQTAVPSVFSYESPQKPRKPSKYLPRKDAVDFFIGNDQASADTTELEEEKSEIAPDNDQASADTTELEEEKSEIAAVPGLLQEGNEARLSFNECSLSGGSKTEIENLKRKLNLLQKKFQQKEQEMENLQKNLSALFADDQIHCFKKGFSKNIVWSEETLEKALKIYLYCNAKGYNYLRKIGYPLPSQRTIQRRIQNIIL